MSNVIHPAHFARVALVGRHASPHVAEPLRRLAALLGARGHRVVLESETAQCVPELELPTGDAAALGGLIDLVIVLGGDGTLLSIARLLAPYDVPLIGINLGRLGFLTDVPAAQMESVLIAMLEGAYTEESRALLMARHRRDDQDAGGALALNDVVINRGATGSMVDLTVSIDGRYVYTLRADGLIVTTPTGSTAYALSAMGPILHPGIPAVALVPVAPHALTNRPIAVSDRSRIVVRFDRGSDAGMHCDGHTHFTLEPGDETVIERSDLQVRLLHPQDYDYFTMLRQKLHWSESPETLRAAKP